MRRRKVTRKKENIGKQLRQHTRIKEKRKEYDGNTEFMISTGSTLLDLAISGGRVKGGGIPGGILVEGFGPSGSGKTVLLCEIAGNVQRQNGEIMFRDPEARLNKQFARIFDLNTDNMDYDTPNTIPQLFQGVRDWDINSQKVNGVFADSLAALSTDMEMSKEEGDKMGMRRAKEFSEELRRTCRILAERNILMVASNQVRVNQDAGPYGQKYISPGGEAIGFYSSLRLRFSNPTKIKQKEKWKGKEISKVVGVETKVEVFKSSIWKPYRTAPLVINFDYGIDDIRANLQYLKTHMKMTKFGLIDQSLKVSLNESILMVEEENLEKELCEQVIDLWEEIESKFETKRKPKRR